MTCSLCRGPCRATLNRAIMDALPAETKRLLWGAHLESTCPACGKLGPAGSWCSQCHAPTGPVTWHRAKRSAAQDAAAARLAANRKEPTRRGADSRVALA